jgi:hypothetical protein
MKKTTKKRTTKSSTKKNSTKKKPKRKKRKSSQSASATSFSDRPVAARPRSRKKAAKKKTAKKSKEVIIKPFGTGAKVIRPDGTEKNVASADDLFGEMLYLSMKWPNAMVNDKRKRKFPGEF